jgi:hypothetical protein
MQVSTESGQTRLEPASAVDERDVVPIGAQLERRGEARESPAQDEHTLALVDRTLHGNDPRPRRLYLAKNPCAPFRRSMGSLSGPKSTETMWLSVA